MSLFEADRLWKTCRGLHVEVHEVTHGPLRRFCLHCRDFLRDNASEEDLFWRRLGAYTQRLRFDLAANPTSFAVASEGAAERVETYRTAVTRRMRGYPRLAQQAIDLLEAAGSLVASAEAPLLEHIFCADLLQCEEGRPVGLVVPEPRYLSALRTELASLELEAAPLVTRDLASQDTYARLIFSGPTAWYPDSVITSPRASELVFVHFDWVGPDRPPRALLPSEDAPGWSRKGLPGLVRRTFKNGDDPHEPELIPDMEPTIDWTALFSDVATDGSSGEAASLTLGRLCVLEGGWAVLLRGYDEGRVYAISFDHDDVSIRDMLVDDLRRGDFVLLRTEGGGDYMVELAWAYLGERADIVRSVLRHWKMALGDRLRTAGADEVARELTLRGATAANAINVRAWSGEDRIQPGSRKDFDALMDLLGLGESADEYWRMGRALFRARVRAGHRVRSLLLKQVKECDLGKLHEQGRADFRVQDGGGEISAFRVVALAPEALEVPSYRIQDPFRLADA